MTNADMIQHNLEIARERANSIRDRLVDAIAKGDRAAEERLEKVHAAAIEEYRAMRLEAAA